MGWNVYKFSDKKNESYDFDDFEKALEMVDEGMDVMCDIYAEMKKEYGKESYKKRDSHDEPASGSYMEKRRMMRRSMSR